MRCHLLLVLLLLLALPIVEAKPTNGITQLQTGLTISTNIPSAISQNITREFEINIINATKQFTSEVTCVLHIYDEDLTGGHLYTNISSTFSNTYDIEMVVLPEVHSTKGLYSYKVICNTSTETGLFENTYYVTKEGNEPAGDLLQIFIYGLAIFTFCGLFFTLLSNIAKTVMLSMNIYDVIISIGFYLLCFVVVYLSETYLISVQVENMFNFLISTTAYTNVILPIIEFIVAFIIRGLQRKDVEDPKTTMGGLI